MTGEACSLELRQGMVRTVGGGVNMPTLSSTLTTLLLIGGEPQ